MLRLGYRRANLVADAGYRRRRDAHTSHQYRSMRRNQQSSQPNARTIASTSSPPQVHMPLTSSSAAFLVATSAYLGIRSYFKRRIARTTGAVTKGGKADFALVGLVVVGQIVMPLLAIFSPWLDSTQYRTPLPALAWGGALLMASGIWLFWRSHADLGENWSVTLKVQQRHKLVCDGVYRAIRHPMYASFFVMAIGQLLLPPNWIAGPSALLAVAMLYFIRKPKEEAMLLDQFGEDYR